MAQVEVFVTICYNYFEKNRKNVKPNPIFVGIYSEDTLQQMRKEVRLCRMK